LLCDHQVILYEGNSLNIPDEMIPKSLVIC